MLNWQTLSRVIAGIGCHLNFELVSFAIFSRYIMTGCQNIERMSLRFGGSVISFQPLCHAVHDLDAGSPAAFASALESLVSRRQSAQCTFSIMTGLQKRIIHQQFICIHLSSVTSLIVSCLSGPSVKRRQRSAPIARLRSIICPLSEYLTKWHAFSIWGDLKSAAAVVLQVCARLLLWITSLRACVARGFQGSAAQTDRP